MCSTLQELENLFETVKSGSTTVSGLLEKELIYATRAERCNRSCSSGFCYDEYHDVEDQKYYLDQFDESTNVYKLLHRFFGKIGNSKLVYFEYLPTEIFSWLYFR